LLGHALRKALGVITRQQGRGLAEVAAEAGVAPLVGGPHSLKAALDLDWDDPQARTRGLIAVLGALDAVERWLEEQVVASDPQVQAQVQASRAAARQVRQQDVEMTAEGLPALRRGVSRDRRISIEDAAMRHGRKSRHVRIDGYKRHVLHDLDSGLIRAVGLTAANAPEASVTADLEVDLQAQRLGLVDLDELHLDRAYLSSRWVRERPASLAIYCKAWPVRNAGRFPKTAFTLDWQRRTIQCPNHVRLPFEPGGTLQQRCTTSVRGRSVHIHPDERLLAELRERQHTPPGRAKLRERIAVEHTLAHVGYWQGRRARYCGQRKNLFDLRRCAVVDNLHVMSRLSVFAGEPRQDKEAA
jgi:transposase